MQIKITIDDTTYKKLKKSAKDNLRSLSNEAFFRLRGSFISPTPSPVIPTPIINPTIPVEPYRITLTNSTEPTAQTGEGTATVPTTQHEQKKEPIGTVYKSDYKPTLNVDDFDEPEPEWDADRGGARPRVL